MYLLTHEHTHTHARKHAHTHTHTQGERDSVNALSSTTSKAAVTQQLSQLSLDMHKVMDYMTE